jgi:hypothetical protein
MRRNRRSAMTLPASVCVFAYGLSIIGGGGFVVGWNPGGDTGGGTLVIRNILVNRRIGGSQLVNGGIILVFIIGDGRFVGGIDGPAIPYSSHFSEPVTLPFTTVHSPLNVPSPVTGACSLVVPCSVILLVVVIIFEWTLIVLRPSK